MVALYASGERSRQLGIKVEPADYVKLFSTMDFNCQMNRSYKNKPKNILRKTYLKAKQVLWVLCEHSLEL